MRFQGHCVAQRCLTVALRLPPRARVLLRRRPAPAVPANDRIEPGGYDLKGNHGSGMVRKIGDPLAGTERAELQALCRYCVAGDYGRTDGEWW